MSTPPDGARIEEQRMRWSKSIEYIGDQLNVFTSTPTSDISDRDENGDLVENATQVYKSLLKINLFWTYPILVEQILDICSRKVSSKLACLASLVNNDVNEFGELLCKQAMLRFAYHFRKGGDGATENLKCISALLCELFNYNVVNELMVLQILQLLVDRLEEKETSVNKEISLEDLLDVVAELLEICGRKLFKDSRPVYDAVLEKLKKYLVENDDHTQISDQLKQRISTLLELGEKEYIEVPDTPMHMGQENKSPAHSFILERDTTDISPDFHLNEFKYTARMAELEKEFARFKGARTNEPSLLSTPSTKMSLKKTDHETGAHKNEGREPTISKGSSTEDISTNVVQDRTNHEDIEFKKKIYLILKSSLSSDEAAHKLLLLRIPDDEKYRVVEVLVKSMIQEPTFSKFFGLLADKLCASHRSWKSGFEKVFSENISNESLVEFDPSQLRILGKFWGHLLSSDFLGLEVFQQIKMNERDSTPPLRILVKFIFQELVYELGVDELKERLAEEHIKPYLSGVFPEENVDDIRYSINYFTAIGLGMLTEGMRDTLNGFKQREERVKEEEREKHMKMEVETPRPVNEESDNKMVDDTKGKEESKSRGRGQFRRRTKQELEHSGKFPNESSAGQFRRTPRFKNTAGISGDSKRERSITPPRRRTRFNASGSRGTNVARKRERSITPPRKRRR